jgi:DNA primase
MISTRNSGEPNNVGGGILDFLEYMEKGTKREAYLKACEISGIQAEPLSDQEISKLVEKEEVLGTLTAAADIYHANLAEEHYSFIFNQWGITRDSADEWKLGYALPSRNLKELNPKSLIKTGLVNITETGNTGREYYQGRVIFPYIFNGKVHYISGRETAETPEYEKQSGAMKYKGSSLFLMDKMLFQFTRIGFCDDIHTKQRRANISILEFVLKKIQEFLNS